MKKTTPQSPRKRPGRPRKGEPAGKTAQFTARITPALRRELEKACKERDAPSLSDEIEMRLWRSFHLDKERSEFIDRFGGPQGYAFARFVANFMKNLSTATGRRWASDPWTYNELRRGLLLLLDRWAPPGDAKKPELKPQFAGVADQLGETLVNHQLQQLILEGVFPSDDLRIDHAETRLQIKADLGDLVGRWNVRDDEKVPDTEGKPDD